MNENRYCVYIIYSIKVDRYYIGSTDEFEVRLGQHNTGLYDTAFTSKGIPWAEKLVIDGLTSAQAYAMEKHFKKMKSRKYLENLFMYADLVEKLKKRFE